MPFYLMAPAHRPKIRALVVALEAVFSAVFWSMVPSEKEFGLSHMCPWNPDAFEWLGLRPHSPLRETIRCPEGEMGFLFACFGNVAIAELVCHIICEVNRSSELQRKERAKEYKVPS